VKKVFIASGIRYDLILNDREHGLEYLKEVVKYHISGQLKIAPEHTEDKVLQLMGKPRRAALQEFRDYFYRFNEECGLKQFLTYYFIAAHPGCDLNDMARLRDFASRELKLNPEQVQIFTPLPSTYSTLMYYTGRNPFTGRPLFVEKDINRKEKQKEILVRSNRPKKR
jgi:uncharacterized radical SAM protein YgiQ